MLEYLQTQQSLRVLSHQAYSIPSTNKELTDQTFTLLLLKMLHLINGVKATCTCLCEKKLLGSNWCLLKTKNKKLEHIVLQT